MRDNLLTYLYENASRDNDIALTYRRKLRRSAWSYARLARTAFQIARELEKRGIGKGDHIVIWSENCPEWVAAFYGALLRGAVVVPLDEQSTTDFVTRVTDTTGSKLFLFGSRTRPLHPAVDALHLEELCRIAAAHPADVYPAADIHREDTVELVFTSG